MLENILCRVHIRFQLESMDSVDFHISPRDDHNFVLTESIARCHECKAPESDGSAHFERMSKSKEMIDHEARELSFRKSMVCIAMKILHNIYMLVGITFFMVHGRLINE